MPAAGGAESDIARRVATTVRELTALLGSEIRLEPMGLSSHVGPGPHDGFSLSGGSQGTSELGGTSSRPWPAARYLGLTIASRVCGSDDEETAECVEDRRVGAWRIVFPKDMPHEEGLAKVRTALATLQRNRAAAVAERVARVSEVEHQLQDLQSRFLQEMETLRREGRERQTELCRLAMLALQNLVLRPQLVSDPLVAQLQAVREDLLKRRQQLLMTHTAEHPGVKQVESLLAEVEQEIQLRSRRQKEYSASGGSGEINVPAAGTTWLALPPDEQVGAPPPYELSAIRNSSERPGLPSNNEVLWQRFASLQSEIQSWDAKLAEGIDGRRGSLEELQGRLAAVETELRDALTDWKIAQGCVLNLEGGPLSSNPREMTKSLTPFSLLLALLVGLLAQGAVTSLMIGFADDQRVSTAEQLFAITGGPVFHVNLSTGDGKFMDGMDSVSPPHFVTAQADAELSSKPKV